MIAVEVIFWISVGLLVFAQLGYPLLLGIWGKLSRRRAQQPKLIIAGDEPFVTLVIAAHREQSVIASRVANARQLDWPAERLEVIVACDGSPDETAAEARSAGADVVLELEWGGKVRAQDAAVAAADPRSTVIAFSDANASWEPDALRVLVGELGLADVGYVCGQVRFSGADGSTNQEGLYWRFEMWQRARESQLASVTGGNGAIYAVRRADYIEVDPVMGHDLSFPFNFVKRGRRALYAPSARASEKMVPTVEGEFARKRRMMSHAWPIVLRGGLLSPRGYPFSYAVMIYCHRGLRYVTPKLHIVTFVANLILIGQGTVYLVTLALQLLLLLAALLGAVIPFKPLLIARYYVLTTASIGAGLWDYLRHGTPAGWAPPEGTR
ncbi:MAG: glycosyltransferase [Solirubrobacteraceae bacterium]|nr:glycosyltransferase [Solirubrobacteraceae bacterium]MDP4920923.1 glycosyltransferase [Solirubrobacteraceae bacterium]